MYTCVGSILLAVVLFAAAPVEAQVWATDFPFRRMNESARSLGLGEATVALRGYPHAHHINPATLGRGNAVQVGSNFNFTDQPIPFLSSDRGTTTVTAAPVVAWMRNPWLSATYNRWSLAYAYKALDFGTFTVPGLDQAPPEELPGIDTSHKISVAHHITRSLSIGVGLNRIKSTIPDPDPDRRTVTDWSYDAGMYLTRVFTVPQFRFRPTFGWSVTDFGQPKTIEDTGRRIILPTTLRVGLSLQLTTAAGRFNRPWARIGLHINRSRGLPAVDAEGMPDGAWETLFYTGWQPVEVNVGTISNPELTTVSGAALLDRQTGIELAVLDIFALRRGRFTASLASEAVSFSTWGLGIDVFYVALDYARITPEPAAVLPSSNGFWNLTLRLPIGRNRHNPWATQSASQQ